MFSRQTFKVWQLLKQTVTPNAVSCLYVFDQRVSLIFHFSQLSDIFLAQKQHTCLQKLFLTSGNPCKEYFVEQKQIKSATALNFERLAAKHVMFAPTHVFSSRVHAYMQPTVSTKLEKLPYFARIKTGFLRPLYCPDRQKHPLTLLKRQLSSFRAGFVRNKHFAPQMRSVRVACVQTSPLWGRGIVLRLRQTISLFSVNIPPGIPLAKFANFMDFKVHFPVVSMNLRIQQLTKPCEGGWPCIDQNNWWWFRIRFLCVLIRPYETAKCFLPCKNEWEDLYVQRKHFYYKRQRSGYFSNIEQSEYKRLCSPHADHCGDSHHFLHIWRNQVKLQNCSLESRLVHRRYLHEV